MSGDKEQKCNKESLADKEWLSPTEFAAWTGVSRNTVYEEITRDRLPGVARIGKRIIINKQALIDAATAGSGNREAEDV